MLSKEEVDRQEFEDWYTNTWHPINMKRNRFNNYIATDHAMAWDGWQARSAELLSLREQLAELKALEPVAEFRKPSKKHEPMVYWFGKQVFPVGTQLFTVAKPAEDD